MDVIFLSGIYSFIPQRALGPYLLKHVLQTQGYSCQVVDFCQELTAEQICEFVDKLTTENTLCLALSSTFWFDEASHYYKYDNGIPPTYMRRLN